MFLTVRILRTIDTKCIEWVDTKRNIVMRIKELILQSVHKISRSHVLPISHPGIIAIYR